MPKRYLRQPDGTLVEYNGGSGGDISREEFDNLSEAIANHGVWFAVCNTYSSGVRIASTQSGDFELSVGARVGVLMGYDMHGTKLNVDNTGTYPIASAHYTTTDENGETVDVVNDDIPVIWQAHGQVIWFTFDGVYWIADSSVRATEDTVGVVTLSDKIDKVSSTTAASSTAVKTAYDKAVEALNAANSQTNGGLSTTAKTLLITILRNGIYTTDQSANINALETALETSGGASEYFFVRVNLTNATSSNSNAIVKAGAEYITIIAANEGYVIADVVVTMGGSDVTNNVYDRDSGTIAIPSVNGDIDIIVTATQTGNVTDIIQTDSTLLIKSASVSRNGNTLVFA